MRYKKQLNFTGLLAALSLTAAILACSFPGTAPVIVVTATPVLPTKPPTATVPPTAIPTATPIPPTPTPTAAPNVALAQADSALRNGDYDSAVAIYQSILSRPVLAVDPILRVNAAMGLGTAALREGKFGDAVTALSTFIQTYPADSRLPQAYFLRGDAYMGLNQWQNAINDYQVYLEKRPGLIDSYVYERIGDAQLALKTPTVALQSYGKAVDSARGLVPMLALREKVAAANLNTGNVKDALTQYDAILTVAKNPGYRASITLTAANLQLATGSAQAAYGRYQEILTNYPDTLEAYRAMQALLKANVPVDGLLRGRISFNAKDYSDAITALLDYTGKTPPAKIDPLVFMWLGRAYREAGNYSAAMTAFKTVIDTYPTSTYFGDAWIEQGRTLFVSGKADQAITKYVELSEKYPKVPQGAEALWRAGYLYSTMGVQEQSLATFEILGNKYKGSEWAMDGLFRGGMAAYNRKQNARAQRFFLLLATTGTGNLKAAGYLWLGRLYQIDKQDQLARDAYTEAAKADPGGYYSLRAADLLKGRGPFVPPAKLDLSFNDPAHIAEAENWLRKTFKITQEGALWPLSPTLANDPRIIRGQELWSLTAAPEARGEFESVMQDNEGNALATYQLASLFYRIGWYELAINTTAKWLDNAKINTQDAPKAIAALRFPIAYYDLVLPLSQKYKIDPLLVFALMRQESLFQGGAQSYAAAQGLMQIIPDTADYIARKLEWQNWNPRDIYRPYINVEFGIYYLKEQLDTFDGNPYAALAAYNGGPGNSAEWLRISNGDPDLFIQAISYDETQAYVRRIYEQYEMYALIYAGK